MGNAGSSSASQMQRERHKSSELSTPNSPANFRDSIASATGGGGGGGGSVGAVTLGGGAGGQHFTFDKKLQTTDDEEQPYYTKQSTTTLTTTTAAATAGAQTSTADSEFGTPAPRKRSSTVSEGTKNAATSLHNSVSEMSTNANDDENANAKEDAESQAAAEDPKLKTALPTVLRWDGGGKNVMISGTFSKWKPIPMVRSHGNFVTIIDLPEGDHQYKFCVDGEWKHDPKSKSIDNEQGEKNNLVSVRESDFEVFQALAKDSENVPNYAEREYSQEVPAAKPWEKVSGPPVLPPHLLQVILNKDTPLSCEPTLLPEPNHVMLNHLYALSIKDGVMVLSATHRYRKKYVTTLLYKPI